jgi:hypothetical protein
MPYYLLLVIYWLLLLAGDDILHNFQTNVKNEFQ